MFWEHIDLWTVALVAVAGGIITGIVGTVAKNWRKARESEHLAVLKQSMIEKGMSADEIERVVNAGRKVKDDD